jgi:4-amino-4-deoxy-L-arabinose transferase-like glycosyltransferase
MRNGLEPPSNSAGRWFETHYFPVLCALLLIGIATRIALFVDMPRPFGYVWDLYHEGVVWIRVHGRLPFSEDCLECYQPPLLFACGAPLYALGASVFNGGAALGLRFLVLFSMACSGVVIFYCYKTLRLLTRSRAFLLLGVALALVFPCLFIDSGGSGNDVLAAALMTAFFYLLCLRQLHPARGRRRETVAMGILAGLSALTKYTGLVAIVVGAAVMSPAILFGRRRLRAARDLAVMIVVAAAVCGWYYARNIAHDGRLFAISPWGNRNAFAGGTSGVARYWKQYDFRSLEVKEVVDLYRPENVGTLNSFPVYDSVFSSLHAQAWTDMSFFSVPSRHGWVLPHHYAEDGADIPMLLHTPASTPREPIYPPKRVIPRLIDLVLRLGMIPTLLALAGFAVTLRRRALRPFVVMSVISSAIYVRWFLAQPSWGLKTKYLLFLLPVYIVYAVLGLRSAYRLDRRLGLAAAVGLIAALAVSEAYLLMFALG